MTTTQSRPTDVDVDRICSSGTEEEVRAAITTLIDAKTTIQQQLSRTKSDMLAERSELVRSGLPGKAAQIAATAASDNEWRGRAVRAAIGCDRKLAKLRAELATRAPQLKPRPAAPARERRVVGMTKRSLAETVDFIQSFVDDGWSLIATLPHEDGSVLVFRQDNPGVTSQ
jgi:hypothetical protein